MYLGGDNSIALSCFPIMRNGMNQYEKKESFFLFFLLFGPQQQHGESFLPNIRSMKPFFSAMNSIAPRAPKILLNLLILDMNYGCSDNSLFR